MTTKQQRLDLTLFSACWPKLDNSRKAYLAGRLTPRLTSYIPKIPTDKQAGFLLLDILEAMYGGAAGGGKSEALLMAALQYVDVPGYTALLLRKTYADLSLPGALMDRAHGWLGSTDANWQAKERRWVFPSGASLTFGYLETEQDKYRYQSAEFTFVGFDELSQFTESQYRYLFSRVRRAEGVKIPLRIRSASNPGGVGHEWVKNRFLSQRHPHRAFVPARLKDNPHLDQEAYMSSLGQLDPVTRRRLQDGDWEVRDEGGMFKREWLNWLDAAPALNTFKRIIWYWDLAATPVSEQSPDPDWSVGVLVGMTASDEFTVLDAVLLRDTPAGVERAVKAAAAQYGPSIPVSIEQEPGSSGLGLIDHYRRNVLRGQKVIGDRPTGDKLTRARPVSAFAEAGQLSFVRGGWNAPFIDMLCAFPQDGVHDDPVDALSGAVNRLEALARKRDLSTEVSKWL